MTSVYLSGADPGRNYYIAVDCAGWSDCADVDEYEF